MLRTSFPTQFLTPEDLDLLSRVFDAARRSGDTDLDLECRAASLVQLFQSGIRDEAQLLAVFSYSEARLVSWAAEARSTRSNTKIAITKGSRS